MTIAILCGDDRMKQVYDNLSKDMDVLKIDEETDFLTIPVVDAIIFPVKGMDEQGNVVLHQQSVHIPSTFWKMQGNDVMIFTGIRTKEMERLNQSVIYYMEAEEVIKANAILTAEGVLNELIGSTCKSIYALQIDVVGFGHCGKVIYEMLKNLHVNVRVIRRTPSPETNFMAIDEWCQCGDVIINTSIVSPIDLHRIQGWIKKPLILDIATPEMKNIEELQASGIEYKKIGNLPGRFSCISAGNIIADYIRRIVMK